MCPTEVPRSNPRREAAVLSVVRRLPEAARSSKATMFRDGAKRRQDAYVFLVVPHTIRTKELSGREAGIHRQTPPRALG